MRELTIGKNDAGQRLDRFLSKALPLLPPALAQKYIRIKRVKVNGVFHDLERKNPGKKFHAVISRQTCPDMDKVSLEKILDTLENETGEVFVSDEIREKALIPLERMLEMSK